MDGRGARTGCSCSRTRRTTTRRRSSPSAARRPASAAPSATRSPGRGLRLPGHARHRRGRPAGPGERDAARQAAPAQARHHRRRGLQLLRQPDRPRHRPGGRALSPRLCGQAHGDRRRRRRGARRENVLPRAPGAGRRRHPAGRAHGPRRLRRGHRLLQGPRPAQSLETCGAEVQKGNAPEERKLQRLFRNARGHTRSSSAATTSARAASPWPSASWPTGWTSTSTACPSKYEGLDGTELAISESQERMAVVVAPRGRGARSSRSPPTENLEATVVAEVTEEPRLRMRWRGQDHRGPRPRVPRLQRRGKARRASRVPERRVRTASPGVSGYAGGKARALMGDLDVCSQQGPRRSASTRTIGAGTVVMPYGGERQLTPAQSHGRPSSPSWTARPHTCSVMAYGFEPRVIGAGAHITGAYLRRRRDRVAQARGLRHAA